MWGLITGVLWGLITGVLWGLITGVLWGLITGVLWLITSIFRRYECNIFRRATSMALPMAMRFRHLKTNAKQAAAVYRSPIHGRGLFCKRAIDSGEMVSCLL